MTIRVMGGTVQRTLTAFKVMGGTTLREAHQVKVVRLVETVTPGVYENKLEVVFETVPWISVPGVSLNRTSVVIGPDTHTLGWTREYNEAGAAYDWGVRVNWYVNGVYTAYDTAHQSAMSVQRTFNAEDDVYAVVYYYNSVGGAPSSLYVTSGTV